MTLLIILIAVLATAGVAYYWFFMRGKEGASMPTEGTEEGGEMPSMPEMESGNTTSDLGSGTDSGMEAENEQDTNQN